MRIIPNLIIATGIIVAILAFGAGYRCVGGIAGFIALVVGWKRDWCMESVGHLWGPGDQRKPFWNVAAITLPFVASVGAYIAGAEPMSLKPLLYMIPACAVASLLGVGAAIVALVRRERWQQLSIIALFFDSVLFLWMFGIIAREVF
jgi:hypothetical protein